MVFRSSCDVQSERSQFRASGFIVRVKNASDSHAFCDLDKQRRVFDINNLSGGCLGYVQRQLENIRVRFPETNEAGGNKSVHKPSKFEGADTMCVQFARLVTDDDNLQSVFGFQAANQFNHLGVRFRLREHETSKLGSRERTLLIEDHAVQIFVESNFILFVGFKVQAMPLFHLCPVQLKMFRCPPAGMMIPAVGEQDTADVEEEGCDWHGFFHEVGGREAG